MKPSIHLLMTLVLFVAAHRAVAQVPFTLSASLTNGTFVRSVTTADVNNDGKPDLICVRGNPSMLYVWTNSGSGLFVSNASYAVGSFPYQVIAADVNNDGWPDLITANNNGNSLTVLTNDGKGGFVLAATLPLASNNQTRSVAAADFNGDGRLDLVCANFSYGTVTVWTNAGGGNFVSNASYTVSSNPDSVTTTDVNGDGKPDIICANNGNTFNPVTLLTNNGNGGFASAPMPNLGGVLGASWVTAADVNGDGKVDLILIAILATSSEVMVLTNNGGGGFALSGNYPVGSNPYAVVAADVNGDGWVDLITANQGNNTLTVLTNNGTGVFGSNATLTVGSGPESLTAADINGDGRVDLISGGWNSPGALTVLTNAATFMPRLTLKHSGNNVIVSWPAIWANWTLKQSASLDSGGWTSFSGPIGNDGTTKSATNSSPVANRFFRLSNP
ncbi:MAG: VCBS repeat-containing protein [Verrucomicrobiota bacterium]|jgi:hypothetical protein